MSFSFGQTSLGVGSSSQTIRSSVKKDTSGDTFDDIKKLFDILKENRVPGPRLLRLQQEFTQTIGDGSEGVVYAPSPDFEQQLQQLSEYPDPTASRSAREWQVRVIKQLRNDEGQSLRHQVVSALSEVQRLCHRRLRTKRGTKDGIVSLEGWGLCLDSLEENYANPRLPLLILERAISDLAIFMGTEHYRTLGFDDIRQLAVDVGRGLEAVHAVGIAHCDIKPQNILFFYNPETSNH